MNYQSFLERLLEHMGIENKTISVEESPEKIEIQIGVGEEDSGLMIGYRGETIQSLQKILQLVVKNAGLVQRVIVNVNDYKQRRMQQLQETVERIAQRVIETGETYRFGFLPAGERLVVHTFIAEHSSLKDQIESVSSGEGKDRRLEIRKKNAE